MDISNLKSFFKLQVVRKDEQLFELKVTASNGSYFGTTDVYDTPETILKFAETLIGFPQENSDLLYETGFKNEYSSFSMHFYRIDKAGQFAVEVNLEDNIKTAFKHELKSKIRVEIIIELKAIQKFQKDLSRLASKQEGIAILNGKDDAIAN
jgi:hypothetical protein